MNQRIIENINLLIVDDKAYNVSALESALETDGLKIYTATAPKNALQICIDNDISIAVIDEKMPEMDGFELLDAIKNNPKTEHIVVVLITGNPMNTVNILKGLNKGAVDYFFKPLDLYILKAKINSLIMLVNHQREIEKKNKELESYQNELFKVVEETEKNKVLKENFLSNMSHEIRTPLNAIVGLISLLEDTALSDEQQEMINLMELSSKSLLGIVNDILESAKINAGKTEVIAANTDIINLVQNICNLARPMAREKGLAMLCDLDRKVPDLIMADELRLNQVLTNLINNAIKFTSTGEVTLGLKMLKKRGENVLLEFSVKDSGMGIPKSSLDRIFTRFEQVEDKTWRTFGGTGLGLSIVKRLVELMGGTLNVESKLGVGTTFTFTNWFQLADKIRRPQQKNHLYDFPKFANDTVLLAEDNAASTYVIVEMLKKWNIDVMNGNEATMKIRGEVNDSRKDIPILSFSASVIEKEKDEAKKAGADDFIEKPFEPKTLYDKIRKMIDRKKGLRPIAIGI
jgi:signal transduction histidine kinase